MSFLSPWSLLALLPLSGLIVVLYLLRVKRRDVMVSSLFLWQMAVADTQAHAPFQKLRRSLLLLLQLLVIAVCVFCIARPFQWVKGWGGKAMVLVLDASASMNATDEPGGRFAVAVQEARTIIGKKTDSDALGLVLAGNTPTILSPLTTDRRKLLSALDGITTTDAATDMREAILLAATVVQSRKDATILTVTDGDFGRLEEMALGGAKLDFAIVGKRGNNVGITAFDVREPLGSGGRQAFVTLQNVTSTTVTVPLSLRVNDRLVDAHEVTLRSGEQKSEIFDRVPADDGGIVQTTIDSKDDLSADNIAAVTIAPRRQRKVLLVSSGNPFLERVLTTDENIVLDEVAPTAFQSKDVSSHDMTLFDDVAVPSDLPAGHYLFWGSKTLGNKWVPAIATSSGLTDHPVVLDWSHSHPLMRFVDLANVNLLRAAPMAPTPWATTLAETDAGPVITVGETGKTRSIFVGFSLTDSDLPLRIAFPIFLTNCVDYLTARPGDASGVVHPGEVFALALPPKSGEIHIRRPDGATDTLPNNADTSALYERTNRVGIYTAQGKDIEQSFAVSLLSPTESNTLPVAHPSVIITDVQPVDRKPADQQPVAATQNTTRVRNEWWPYLAAVALIFLFVEWIVYHRRLGG